VGSDALEASEAGITLVIDAPAAYALGAKRSALLADLKQRAGWAVASHDPDGHPIIFSTARPHRRSPEQFNVRAQRLDVPRKDNAMPSLPTFRPVSEAPGGWSFESHDPDAHGLAFYQDEAKPRRAR